jgi:hypothetical protein
MPGLIGVLIKKKIEEEKGTKIKDKKRERVANINFRFVCL